MKLQRSRSGDRGISVVIGTVLLVGIVTMTMAILAAALLGGDFYSQSPNADIIYEEDADGSVLIALADVRGLSAGNTEIKLENGGSCGYWDGSGTLGKGDATVVEGGDCSKSLEEGDVLQVIGANRLIDTYVVRGVSPKYDLCEEAISDGMMTIKTGDEYECDLVSEDGGRVDVDLTMFGGELDGIANLSMGGGLNLHGGTINGEVNSERITGLQTEWTITGDFTIPNSAESDTVALKRDTHVGGRILSDKRSVSLTSAFVEDGVTITGSDELLQLDGESSIRGDVSADRNTVEIGPDSTVTGPITAGEVTLSSEAEVDNNIDAADVVSIGSDAVVKGDVSAYRVTLESGATVEEAVDAADDVTLKSSAIVRDDVIGEDVRLKDGATIKGDVTASTVTCESSATVEGNVDADENNGC